MEPAQHRSYHRGQGDRGSTDVGACSRLWICTQTGLGDKQKFTFAAQYRIEPGIDRDQSGIFFAFNPSFATYPSIQPATRFVSQSQLFMLVVDTIGGEVLSAHYIVSRLVCRRGGQPQSKDSRGTSSLSSFKSLVQWALRVTSSTNALKLESVYDNCTLISPKLSSSLAMHNLDPPFVFMVFVSSEIVKNANEDSADGQQGRSLTVVYIVSKLGDVYSVGSLYFHTSYQSCGNSPIKITFDIGEVKLSSQPPRSSLNFILYFLATSSLFNGFKLGGRKTFAYLNFRPSRRLDSLFSFLRYCGPRCLRSSRRVLLDEDGYQITHIGKGAFAVISRVLHRPSGDVRVMKRIALDKTGLANYLARNEVDALKAVSGNPWFPPLLNHFKDEDEFLVTMPYYHRGDLSGLIEHKGYLGRELAQFYSAQLILAIHSLHKVGIIHRDVKTDNIFLDEQGNLILADLGLAENIATYEGGEEMMKLFPEWLAARDKGGDDFPFLWVNHRNPLSMIGSAGTFWYSAPEVFRKERYSFGVDYWSVGVIYYELITGHIPFNHFKPYPENKRPDLDFRVKPGQLQDIARWEEEAITELLHPQPAYRPRTLGEIKKSPIFDGVDWEKLKRREVSSPLLPQPLQEG